MLTGFEDNARRWRCCCRCCHVRAGSILIGVLEILYMFYQLIHSVILWFNSSSAQTLSFSITMAGIILGIVVVVLLFLGIFSTKHMFLIPHLVMQVAAILLLIAMAILCAIALGQGTTIILEIINVPEDGSLSAWDAGMSDPSIQATRNMFTPALQMVLWAVMAMFIVGAIFEIWFFAVILNCFFYLRAKSNYEKETGVSTPTISAIDAIFPLNNNKNNGNKIQ